MHFTILVSLILIVYSMNYLYVTFFCYVIFCRGKITHQFVIGELSDEVFIIEIKILFRIFRLVEYWNYGGFWFSSDISLRNFIYTEIQKSRIHSINVAATSIPKSVGKSIIVFIFAISDMTTKYAIRQCFSNGYSMSLNFWMLQTILNMFNTTFLIPQLRNYWEIQNSTKFLATLILINS